MKHIKLTYTLLEKTCFIYVRFLHVRVDYQCANIFSNGLTRHLFTKFKFNLFILYDYFSNRGGLLDIIYLNYLLDFFSISFSKYNIFGCTLVFIF